MIQKLLENNGLKCGIISTITSPGLHTTSPPPKLLQKIFADYQRSDFTHVVCEITSHALSQYRYFGTHFKVSLITNITHEHLDYHKTMDNYVRTKAKLFTQSDVAILNRDDDHYQDMSQLIHIPQITYGIKNKSDFTAQKVKLTSKQLSFTVNNQRLITNSNYYYQTYNILAALAAYHQLNLDPSIFSKTIRHFPSSKGRREIVENDLGLKTIIDFAHTTNALTNTLSSLRKTSKGRLIVIFGATGGRDPSKRPLMGQAVSKIADIAIVTADDTREERIENINQQIISGFDPKQSQKIDPEHPEITNPNKFHYADIPNRQDAFNLAVALAKTGDTIIACGKGHESSILHGKTDYPWSEAEAFRTAFRLKNEHV